MLLAAAVVTWMLFWMRRQAASVKGELQAAVDRRSSRRRRRGASRCSRSPRSSARASRRRSSSSARRPRTASRRVWILARRARRAAIAVGDRLRLLPRQPARQPRPSFFRWTGIALIFIAAGLLSHAIHEFIEIGALGSGPWTAAGVRHQRRPVRTTTASASFLRAIFGYSANPEWLTLIVHVAYLVIVLALYLRPLPPRPAPSQPAPQASNS